MNEVGIAFSGKPDDAPGVGSTRIFALITPDTERTFAAYYGVQENLSPEDLDENFIRTSKFMYLDGYALNSRRGGETFLKAAEISKQGGNRVAFAPSDLSILRKYPDVVRDLTRASDLILVNEQEARFITGTEDINEAIRILRGLFSLGAVTAGEQGAHVFDENGVQCVPAVKPPAPVIDTNGAGDAFAGGFLFGLARGMPIEKAAAIGNRCAAEIITHAGARPVSDYRRFVQDI
jgi:sugar/nucleoside kinase (ribokinase family)